MRLRAALVLIVCEDRALVLRRRPDDRSFAHSWCLPGGGVESDETIEQAAARETAEETGLHITPGQPLGQRVVPLERRDLTFEIHLFCARSESDAVVISEEHIAYRWLTRDEARRADEDLPGGLAGETTRELLRRFAEEEL